MGPLKSFVAILAIVSWLCAGVSALHALPSQQLLDHKRKPSIFVAYAFAGADMAKDNDFRLRNLDFFLRRGVTSSARSTITYYVTVSGKHPDAEHLLSAHNSEAGVPQVYVLTRANIGFDFGAHTDTLDKDCERLGLSGSCSLPYDAFIFLNDGTRGPLYPKYMPKSWHWTEAFTDALTATSGGQGNVALVGTSLVCLPHDDTAVKRDATFYGPKVEGFAFAIARPALEYVRSHGSSFRAHHSKEAAIIDGEYDLSRTVLSAPNKWGISSLLLRDLDVDYREKSNWQCNRNVHPSRVGTYGPGISISPLEVIFHKARWHSKPSVMEAEMNKYSEWIGAASYQSHQREAALLSVATNLSTGVNETAGLFMGYD